MTEVDQRYLTVTTMNHTRTFQRAGVPTLFGARVTSLPGTCRSLSDNSQIKQETCQAFGIIKEAGLVPKATCQHTREEGMPWSLDA